MSEHWTPNPHEKAIEDEVAEAWADHLDLQRAAQPGKPKTRMEWVEHLDRVREDGTATLEDHFGAGSPYGEGRDYLIDNLG